MRQVIPFLKCDRGCSSSWPWARRCYCLPLPPQDGQVLLPLATRRGRATLVCEPERSTSPSWPRLWLLSCPSLGWWCITASLLRLLPRSHDGVNGCHPPPRGGVPLSYMCPSLLAGHAMDLTPMECLLYTKWVGHTTPSYVMVGGLLPQSTFCWCGLNPSNPLERAVLPIRLMCVWRPLRSSHT